MRFALALATAAMLTVASAAAQTDHAGHHAEKAKGAAAEGAFAEGEVKKVDKPAGKVTIKHGPLPTLDMPPMTMVFRVKDPAMLDQVKAGDNIKFKAEKVGGAFTVTEFDKK